MGYKKDLRIREHALDVECLDQPLLLMKYTKMLSAAERHVARLEEQQSLMKAEIDKDIRMRPEDFDIDISKIKMTEAVVNGALIMTPTYKEIARQIIEANYEVKNLKGAVKSMEQKKDMIEALIRLNGQHYFAGPSVPRDLSAEVKRERSQKKANSHIKIRRRG